MKRKFILLPITLTALAPAIAITSCSKSDKVVIEPTNELQAASSLNTHYIYTNEPANFTKGTEYVVNVNIEKFDIGTVNTFGFFLSNDAPKKTWLVTKTIPIKKVAVWVDEKELIEIPEQYTKKENAFGIVYDVEHNKYGIQAGIVAIKKNSKIRIEFEVYESVEKFYPVFQTWYGE